MVRWSLERQPSKCDWRNPRSAETDGSVIDHFDRNNGECLVCSTTESINKCACEYFGHPTSDQHDDQAGTSPNQAQYRRRVRRPDNGVRRRNRRSTDCSQLVAQPVANYGPRRGSQNYSSVLPADYNRILNNERSFVVQG